jgi:hypothetical protein
VNSSAHSDFFDTARIPDDAFACSYDFANRSPARHPVIGHDGAPNLPKHFMHSIRHDITAASSTRRSRLPGASPCSDGREKLPISMANRFVAATLVALIAAISLPAHSTQAPLPGSLSKQSGMSHADAHFRIGIRIVSSCRVFVTGQGEVRSTCSSALTPPPLIVAINSIQNRSQNPSREYAITF